jgi:hypothetical protein
VLLRFYIIAIFAGASPAYCIFFNVISMVSGRPWGVPSSFPRTEIGISCGGARLRGNASVIHSMAGSIRASELGLHAEGSATLPASCTDLCDLPWRHPGTRSSAARGQPPGGPGAVPSCRGKRPWPQPAASVVERCSCEVRRVPSGAVPGGGALVEEATDDRPRGDGFQG